ncbi:hypothetical protein MMC18_000202 [Xylographa bjoerkii]|nr:hypothetical protein [Xylographa bjoerkii]
MAIATITNPTFVAYSAFPKEQGTMPPAGSLSSHTNSYVPSTQVTKSPSPDTLHLPSPITRKHPSTSPSPPPKRRVTTSNACTTCKRAKAKCSGSQPVCTRCSRRGEGSTCHYEAAMRSQKEAMIEEIRELRQRYSRAELILQVVAGEEGEGTVEALQRGESYEEIEWGLRAEEREGKRRRVSPDPQREVVSLSPTASAGV